MCDKTGTDGPAIHRVIEGEKAFPPRPLRYSVHESAIVDSNVEIGEGSKIWQFCHVCEDAVIGKNVSIGQGVYIGPGVEIGDRCKIQNHVSIFEGVIIDDDVFVGPGVMFTNVINPRAFINRRHAFQGTSIGKGASIGAGAVILCGRGLGKYCFIGAGAVVTRDIEPYSLQVGVPSKHMSWISAEGIPQINRPGM